jgi:uncharacterized protein (DUF2336 family)
MSDRSEWGPRRVMDIGGFLLWLQHARVQDRCAAAQSIARTALDPALDLEERCIAESALAMLLDDPSSKVRRALADVLSLCARAPLAMLDALALDQHDVAAPVLARSILGDETLIAALSLGNADSAVLIADRSSVSARIAFEIADRCDVRACLALATNPTAQCGEDALSRMIERHAGVSGDLRGALLADPRLTLTQRQMLVNAVGQALASSSFVSRLIGTMRAEALRKDAVTEAPLLIVEQAEPSSLPAYARSLRDAGRLTANLMMKAMVHGRIDFVASCLSELSGRRGSQVRDILVKGGEGAVCALLKDVGFKGGMLPLAHEGLALWRDVAAGRIEIGRQEIAWRLMRRAEELRYKGQAGNDDLSAFLRRIYLDIARANAQAHARGVVDDARREAEAAQQVAAALETEFLEFFEDETLDVVADNGADPIAALGTDIAVDDDFAFDIELSAIDLGQPALSDDRWPAMAEMDDAAFIAALDRVVMGERKAA